MESLGAYACLFPFSATWWLIYLCFWWSFWTQICMSLNHGNHTLFLLDCFCCYWNRYYFDPFLCQTGGFTLSSWYWPEAWAPDSSPIGKHYTPPLPEAPTPDSFLSSLYGQDVGVVGWSLWGMEALKGSFTYESTRVLKGMIYLKRDVCFNSNSFST